MNSLPTDETNPINNVEVVDTARPTSKEGNTFLLYIIKNTQRFSTIIALFLLLLCCWAIGYSLFGNTVGVESQLFALTVLFISAKIAGYLISLLKLPPMVGMLLMGILLKNIGFIEIQGDYRKFAAVLRQLALVNIMLPAGLGLDAAALRKMVWMILNLAIIPVAAEAITIAIAARYLLQFPWLWGLLLGLLISAVSPAVIIPCLFELQDMGYGVNKGIHTLVIAASTINDIICIALFGILIGLIFSTGSLTMQVLQGPIVLIMGFSYGIAWGLICQYLPIIHDQYLIILRTLLLGLGCVVAALGSDAIGYGGAGPLSCIVAAFVASLGWRKQGWTTNNPVRMNFTLLWKFFEPISFGLIGMEVNLSILNGTTVGWSVIVMLFPLLFRGGVSFLSIYWSNFNLKENLFVAVCWIPKATVQAALGPVALDKARELDDENMNHYAVLVVIVAALSIIITSPIGAVLIMQLGPRFLHRTIPESTNI